jgi:site-specific recombinase XerD
MRERSMKVRDAVEEYRYTGLDHAKATQTMRAQRLYAFSDWCEAHNVELEQIKPADVTKFIEVIRAKPHHYTGEKLSTYRIRGYASTLRAFLNWCDREDLISHNIPRRITMPRVETKVIEVFTDEQIKALLKATEHEKDISLEVRDI